MSDRPELRFALTPPDPAGAVLLVHGGPDHSERPTRVTQLSVLRMVPIARRVVEAGTGRLVVARLQNRVGGWNDDGRSAIADGRWAINEMRARFGDIPVSLIGHSMGGRVVMRVADEANVVSVVGMAPWLPPGEPVEPVTGRRVLIIHGDHDSTTDPKQSRAFLEAAASLAASTNYVLVRGAWHPMLRHRRVTEGLAAGFAIATVLGDGPDGALIIRTGNGSDTNLLRQVLAGTGPLVI